MGAERVGPGVQYERWVLATDAGPLVVSLATIDLRNPYVSLAVATHDGVIIGKDERLSSMADRLGAELGINADYFDINESGSPLNLVAENGRVLHQPDRAAALTLDGQGHIAMGSLNWQAHLASTTGAARDVQVLNEWSHSVDLALVTSELGTSAADGATEMVLEPTSTAGQYQVARLDQNLTEVEKLTPDELGLAARGAQALSLAQDFHAGDVVTLTTSLQPAVDGMQLGVGGGPLLVRDGTPFIDPAAPAPEETDVRNPVTGAGVSGDGATLWLVVVDGRQPAVSIGLTRPQLASLFIALGARSAMAFDSGGSSEMVVRHLGDLTTSVANAPSDLRERSVADGLFVLNSAPSTQIEKILLKAQASHVLVGSTLQLEVRAVDANDRPVPVSAKDVRFAANPASAATVGEGGVLTGAAPGSAQVNANVAGIENSALVEIVASVDDLRIAPSNPVVPLGQKLQLMAVATTRAGEPIAIDPGAVKWSREGSGGDVLADGTFVTGKRAAKTTIVASVGGASASAIVLSGEHSVTLQAQPRSGSENGAWHYAAQPLDLPGGVDGEAAPDGAPALRLAYDFSSGLGTRAAYAQSEITLSGQPLALAVDVYGDGNNAWLRGGYRNADGNNESMTIARHVDWRGWKMVRAAIPPQASWPLTWTRFYVVERTPGAREQGSLWFRNFKVFFAGP